MSTETNYSLLQAVTGTHNLTRTKESCGLGWEIQGDGTYDIADWAQHLVQTICVSWDSWRPCMQILWRGGGSSLHLLCHCEALARHKFEIFWVGCHSQDEIRETTLREILYFAGRMGLTWDQLGLWLWQRRQRANWSEVRWIVTEYNPWANLSMEFRLFRFHNVIAYSQYYELLIM